jgi:hypothetical protein
MTQNICYLCEMGTKNEFINISFGQSFWNFVGVKGTSSGRLYQKIGGGGGGGL